MLKIAKISSRSRAPRAEIAESSEGSAESRASEASPDLFGARRGDEHGEDGDSEGFSEGFSEGVGEGESEDGVDGYVLGGGWTLHADDEEGTPCYYHAATGETTWERPAAAGAWVDS